jgi:two-component system sensor histidine kinase/response regulator
MPTNKETNQYIPNILIVDDVPENLRLLGDILLQEDYLVRQVPNGKLALKVAEKEIPDLIFLDIMMPEMDGFEVCSILKKDPNLKDVPVIFISALNDTAAIVQAFTNGGVDYITKPFNAEEVRARAATQIKLRRQTLELQKLITDKDCLMKIIGHDLRGPLGSLLGLLDLLHDNINDYSIVEIEEILSVSSKSAHNVFNLLEHLLKWSNAQSGKIIFEPRRMSFKEICSEIIDILKPTADSKNITITLHLIDTFEVFADRNMLDTILRNLISNAIKFTNRGGTIDIQAKRTTENTIISIKDTGVGIGTEDLKKIFDATQLFSLKGTENENGTGFGLKLCKEFVEIQKGEIWVVSNEIEKGSTFCFTLPSPDFEIEEER